MTFGVSVRMSLEIEENEGQSDPEKGTVKANVLHRFVAKFVDFLIVAASSEIIPPVGFLVGLTYLLIADGLLQGQSIGKRIVGLTTMKVSLIKVASFRDSALRNAPLAAGMVLGLIPYLGWIFLGVIIGLEALLIIGNDQGLRIGDEIAQTQVTDRVTIPQTMA